MYHPTRFSPQTSRAPSTQTTGHVASPSDSLPSSQQWPLQASPFNSTLELAEVDCQAAQLTSECYWTDVDEQFLDKLIAQAEARGIGESFASPGLSQVALPTEARKATGGGQDTLATMAPSVAPPARQFVCWLHGCKGQTFTNFSNYRRHCKERSREYTKPVCPGCGRQFLRETARDSHFQQRRCKYVDVDANGVAMWVPMDQA